MIGTVTSPLETMAAAGSSLAPRPLKTFEDALSETSGAPTGGVRAFNELGIFGRNGAQDVSLSPSVAAHATTSTHSREPRQSVVATDAHVTSARAVAGKSSKNRAGELSAILSAEPHEGAHTATGGIPVAFVRGGSDFEAIASPSRGAPPLPVTRAATPPRETLTVASGGHNDVTVVARAEVEDADATILRRRLEAVAAGFGVRLNSVRLNGGAVPMYPVTGGRNGRHAG